MDILTSCLFFGVLLLLIAATVAVFALRRYIDYGVDPAVLDTFRTRIRAWWLLFGLLACVFLCGPVITLLFFCVLSMAILREYITLTPKSPADHQALFGIYLIFTPLQFILVGVNPEWFQSHTGFLPYQVFAVLLPGVVFLILPGFMAAAGDSKRFLERTAKLQLGLIICVYSLSYAPALLTMELPVSRLSSPISRSSSPFDGYRPVSHTETILDKGFETAVIETITSPENSASEIVAFPYLPVVSQQHFRLLFFFILLTQLGGVFQHLWSQVSRQYIIAPNVNANKTWEGVLGGAVTTALLGVSLWYFTPFPKWWEPGIIAFVTSLMGFFGSITMSAIKRDRGVSGYGSLIQGHSGLLDRMDSLCFAAPVFYHLAWWFSR